MNRLMTAEQVAAKSAKARAAWAGNRQVAHSKVCCAGAWEENGGARSCADCGKYLGSVDTGVAKPVAKPLKARSKRPGNAKPPHPTETQEQQALIQWWDAWCRSRGIDYRLLLAVPNGGFRHIATAARLMAEGVRPGVPDLLLAIARGNHHGLWIEMKSLTGRLSGPQIAVQDLLWAQGYRVATCAGADSAIRVIKEYLEEK